MKRLTRPATVLAALLGAALAWGAAPARAGTLFSDPYGVGSPDVLGSEADFDIRSLEIQELAPNSLRIELRLNYHGGDTSLGGFQVPGTSFAAAAVGIGDLLIQGQSQLWAIPLSGATGGIGGGGIYSVGGPVPIGTPATRSQTLPGSLYRANGTLSAAQVLGVDPAGDFRADVPVWGAIDHFIPDFVGNGPVVSAIGGAEIAILLQIAINPDFYGDVSSGFQLHFASGTCGCDVLDVTVPEPAPLALACAALALTASAARLCLPRGGGSRGRELV